jgi:putative glutamine amidotransferase
MNVAVSMRAVTDEATGEKRDAISRDVIALLERHGATPLLVPNGLEDVAAWMQVTGARCVLLTGGNDLGGSGGGSADAARDATEAALLDESLRRRLPVFGWCRGMQVIVRHFGGGLPERIAPAKGHVRVQHEIEVTPADDMEAQRVVTNSFHDYGVRLEALPAGLAALAMSDDGWVEGVRHRELPVWGVQWHPERAGSCTALDEALLAAWLRAGGAAGVAR